MLIFLSLNFQEGIKKVEQNINEMLQFQSFSRGREQRDFNIILANESYVQNWSLAQITVIFITTITQVYFVRKLFDVKTSRPRAWSKKNLITNYRYYFFKTCIHLLIIFLNRKVSLKKPLSRYLASRHRFNTSPVDSGDSCYDPSLTCLYALSFVFTVMAVSGDAIRHRCKLTTKKAFVAWCALNLRNSNTHLQQSLFYFPSVVSVFVLIRFCPLTLCKSTRKLPFLMRMWFLFAFKVCGYSVAVQ